MRQNQLAQNASGAAASAWPGSLPFEFDIQPVLTRFGCNAGAATARPAARTASPSRCSASTRTSITTPSSTRPAAGASSRPTPENSLLLRKPAGQVPARRRQAARRRQPAVRAAPSLDRGRHAADAGRRPEARARSSSSRPSVVWRRGSEAAAPGDRPTTPTARPRRDRRLAQFQSNDSAYRRRRRGRPGEGRPVPGRGGVMARFMEKFAVCNVVIPLPGNVRRRVYAKLPREQLHRRPRLGEAASSSASPPSEPAGRCDVPPRGRTSTSIGRLPTPDETRAFLADTAPTSARS